MTNFDNRLRRVVDSAENQFVIFGRKRFALCYRTVVCLSVLSVCLSVALVYCGQTVRFIKMKLGMQVGLGPGLIVLDGDPISPSPKGAQPPNLRPISVVAKWLDGSGCYLVGGRSRPKQHYVRWGPSSPFPKRGQRPHNFRPMSIVVKIVDQDATWYVGRPQPRS